MLKASLTYGEIYLLKYFTSLLASVWWLQNGHATNPYCQGIDGVFQAYYQTLQTVQLYGPTNFSPVINHVARSVVLITLIVLMVCFSGEFCLLGCFVDFRWVEFRERELTQLFTVWLPTKFSMWERRRTKWNLKYCLKLVKIICCHDSVFESPTNFRRNVL